MEIMHARTAGEMGSRLLRTVGRCVSSDAVSRFLPRCVPNLLEIHLPFPAHM